MSPEQTQAEAEDERMTCEEQIAGIIFEGAREDLEPLADLFSEERAQALARQIFDLVTPLKISRLESAISDILQASSKNDPDALSNGIQHAAELLFQAGWKQCEYCHEVWFPTADILGNPCGCLDPQ